MSESSAEVNEADRLEQERPVADEDVSEGMGPELSPLDANEADVLEQQAVLPADDEDAYS
jgi:hypothetical protein